MEHYQCAWTPESSGADALPAGPWVGHHFEECTFDGLDLTGFDLRNTRFEHCTFRKCTLADVRLTGVRLHGVRFEHCTLPNLRWSTLDTLVLDFTLVDCRAPLGDWGEMDLQGIQFKASDLSGGNFFKTDARKTAWTDCRLRDVVFDRTDLREADFRGATDWIIDPAENRLHGARFDANDLTGLVQSLGIQLD